MPELPEVEMICRMLRERILNQKVISVNVLLPRIIREGDLNTIVGSVFTRVYRQGKFICFDLDNELKMYAHLRMTGTFLWQDDLPKKPSHVRVEIEFEKGTLLYRDIRTLGGIWIAENGKPPWKKMGVDPFDDEFTSERLSEMFDKRKIAVKQALLDQSLVAGLGNIYSSEALFKANIHPGRTAGSLDINEITRLRDAIKEILTAAIEAKGTTFRDFQLSDGKEGGFQDFLSVYRKEGLLCSRCGTQIERIVQAQRSTYFCPKCQG